MLRWLARAIGAVALVGGLGFALVPFSATTTVRDDPRVEVTSHCSSPVGAAVAGGGDSAYFLAGDAEPVVSDDFGCRTPARQRALGGAAGVLFGGALLVVVGGGRRARRRPEPSVLASWVVPPEERRPPLPEPPPPPPPLRDPAPTVAAVPAPAASLDQLALIRARQVLRRYLPPAPAKVAEVGRAVHQPWLTESGYRVEAVTVGESGYVDRPNGGDDVVLLLGSLAAVPDRAGRVALLGEVRRLVKPGGLVAVGATNRFAALFHGLADGGLFDPARREAVGATLAGGDLPGEHLHHPDELRAELADANLEVEELVGLEGLAGWLPQLSERWSTMDGRRVIVEAIQGVESEATLLGVSAHLLAVTRRR